MFTQNTKDGTRYALVCLKEGEALPQQVSWKMNAPKIKSTIKLLHTGENVKWFMENGSVVVILPKTLLKTKEVPAALAFAFTAAE